MVSIPLSVYTSRISVGSRAKDAGFFSIPEEAQPPFEILRMRKFLKDARPLPDFAAAVTDPVVNALACASSALHGKQAPQLRNERMRHLQRLLTHGPQVLTTREKLMLLGDGTLFSQLHAQADQSATLMWRSIGAGPTVAAEIAPS